MIWRRKWSNLEMLYGGQSYFWIKFTKMPPGSPSLVLKPKLRAWMKKKIGQTTFLWRNFLPGSRSLGANFWPKIFSTSFFQGPIYFFLLLLFLWLCKFGKNSTKKKYSDAFISTVRKQSANLSFQMWFDGNTVIWHKETERKRCLLIYFHFQKAASK